MNNVLYYEAFSYNFEMLVTSIVEELNCDSCFNVEPVKIHETERSSNN
jgi:hypothetical protein